MGARVSERELAPHTDFCTYRCSVPGQYLCTSKVLVGPLQDPNTCNSLAGQERAFSCCRWCKRLLVNKIMPSFLATGTTFHQGCRRVMKPSDWSSAIPSIGSSWEWTILAKVISPRNVYPGSTSNTTDMIYILFLELHRAELDEAISGLLQRSCWQQLQRLQGSGFFCRPGALQPSLYWACLHSSCSPVTAPRPALWQCPGTRQETIHSHSSFLPVLCHACHLLGVLWQAWRSSCR